MVDPFHDVYRETLSDEAKVDFDKLHSLIEDINIALGAGGRGSITPAERLVINDEALGTFINYMCRRFDVITPAMEGIGVDPRTVAMLAGMTLGSAYAEMRLRDERS